MRYIIPKQLKEEYKIFDRPRIYLKDVVAGCVLLGQFLPETKSTIVFFAICLTDPVYMWNKFQEKRKKTSFSSLTT